ncbi:MAG: motility-associated protein, partial [Polyangiaceae bacterium]
MSGSLGPFIDPPSAMIVFGGSIAVTLIMESMQNVKAAFSVAKNAFKTKGGKASETIKVILELSNAARREGILALETKKVDDTFLQKGLR